MTTLPLHRPATSVLDLSGGQPAVVTPAGTLSHDDLRHRVDDWAAEHLTSPRRLVLLECDNSLDSLIAYLAVLLHGHVGIISPPLAAERRAELLTAYSPHLVRTTAGVRAHSPRREPDLHPDLALLLSTSGSTGSPRMVRISHDNLRSNAEAIAAYLELREDDVAVTSLPLHYCYGLSVLHSHLLVGGAVALTGAGVLDPCFWSLVEEAGVTTLAAVPHTIDLLDRSGFADRSVPSLRRITQAGGRLAPDRVRRLARLGRERGFELVVMYGQSEATARMAWLPPHLAESAPDAVGVAIPGGHLRIEGAAADGVGEVVYTGPNVMMGYATGDVDLAGGPGLADLHTGDLGRFGEDGLLRLTGRANRTAKLFGLRLDLDRVERQLADNGSVRCLVEGSRLHVVGPVDDLPELATAAAALSGLPTSVVRAHRVDELPRTPSDKVDYVALAGLLTAAPAKEELPSADGVLADVALVLGRPDATQDDTFVSLGGDSLSYVELATRLEARLGDLPPDWHLRPIGELAATAAATTSTTPSTGSGGTGNTRRRRTTTDTTIVLRAAAIVAIVASHVDLVTLEGGAHLLLALAGWSFARFQLGSTERGQRLRHGLGSLCQLLVPAVLWLGAVAVLTRDYHASTVLMVHRLAGGGTWHDDWQHWFLQALVWVTLASLALVAVPAVHRLERRHPFGFALGVVAALALVRFAWVGLEAGPLSRYTTPVVAVFFALGWAGARASTAGQKWLVTVLAAVTTVGFFGEPWREAVVVGGIALALWLPRVTLPRVVFRVVAALATYSLFVYLTHWQVYPPLEDAGHPWLALAASFVVGTAYGLAVRPLTRAVRRRL